MYVYIYIYTLFLSAARRRRRRRPLLGRVGPAEAGGGNQEVLSCFSPFWFRSPKGGF